MRSVGRACAGTSADRFAQPKTPFYSKRPYVRNPSCIKICRNPAAVAATHPPTKPELEMAALTTRRRPLRRTKRRLKPNRKPNGLKRLTQHAVSVLGRLSRALQRPFQQTPIQGAANANRGYYVKPPKALQHDPANRFQRRCARLGQLHFAESANALLPASPRASIAPSAWGSNSMITTARRETFTATWTRCAAASYPRLPLRLGQGQCCRGRAHLRRCDRLGDRLHGRTIGNDLFLGMIGGDLAASGCIGGDLSGNIGRQSGGRGARATAPQYREGLFRQGGRRFPAPSAEPSPAPSAATARAT